VTPQARFREAACGAIGSAQGDPSCRPEKIMIEPGHP